MDQTIYFSTLDQYKYNPALIIGGEVGTEVTASARGIVKSVEVNAQTGNTVTMDLGNGYEAVYGQLKSPNTGRQLCGKGRTSRISE